jgi:hypothetical protein
VVSRRSTDANSAGVHWFASIPGDHVFIDGDARVVEGMFGDFSGQADSGDVAHHQVIVSASGNQPQASCDEFLSERAGVVNDLAGIVFEGRLKSFVEADGLGRDDVHERSPLNTREHGAVHGRSVFAAAEDEPGPRTAKSFVGGGRYKVRYGDRTVVDSGGNESRVVCHIHHEQGADGAGNFSEPGVINFARISACRRR